MNKFIGTGRWSKDIELRFLQDGTAVASSSLAVDEGYGDKKKTHFFNVVMWKKTAEAVAEFSGKGKRVAIEGRLQQRSYEKNGSTVYVVEIVAEQVEFLEPKNAQSNTSQSSSFMNGPFFDDGKPVDISDDDLPF